MSDHLTPYEVAARQFGSRARIEEILGLKRTAAYLYQRPASGRDAGDFPSARHQRRLLAHAAATRTVLLPEWLIWGATEAEIAAEEARVAAMAAAHARVAEAGPPFTFPGGSRVEAAE